MHKLSDLKKIIDRLVDTYPDMELDVVYRYISADEKKLKQKMARMELALKSAHDFVSNYADVEDTDENGSPMPNEAMILLGEIDRALDE
jgi:hypothetical protein